MRRREFITFMGGAAVAWPLGARAQQQQRMPVIGYLSARSVRTDLAMTAAFQQGLAEAGYIDGQNVAIEYRWGDGHVERVTRYVDDLVRRQAAVIVTAGGERIAQTAKEAT